MFTNGRWLYVSNRGHNSVVIYHLDMQSGLPTRRAFETRTIKGPRNFYITPSGAFMLVANRKSKSLSVFHVTPKPVYSGLGTVLLSSSLSGYRR